MDTAPELDFSPLKRRIFAGDPAPLPPDLLRRLGIFDSCAEVADPLVYRQFAVHDVRLHGTWLKVAEGFRRRGIRFLPIKGADLAWRCYPGWLIRPMIDLDILIHPEDFDAARAILQENDWEIPYRGASSHHEAVMVRHRAPLELHFDLPGIECREIGALWSEFEAAPDGGWRLPEELNLLMLFGHSRGHRWSNGIQLLFDCAFLLKSGGAPPEWERMAQLAVRFRQHSPEILFAAFPDLFPPEFRGRGEFAPESLRLLRELLLTPAFPITRCHVERVMGGADRFSWRWWRARLKGMAPASIRRQTGNPRGQYLRLLRGYGTVMARKFREFRRFRRGIADEALKRRLAAEERLEELLK